MLFTTILLSSLLALDGSGTCVESLGSAPGVPLIRSTFRCASSCGAKYSQSRGKVVANAWPMGSWTPKSTILAVPFLQFLFSHQKPIGFEQKLTCEAKFLVWFLRMRLIQDDVQWLDVPVIHRRHHIHHVEETLWCVVGCYSPARGRKTRLWSSSCPKQLVEFGREKR